MNGKIRARSVREILSWSKQVAHFLNHRVTDTQKKNLQNSVTLPKDTGTVCVSVARGSTQNIKTRSQETETKQMA